MDRKRYEEARARYIKEAVDCLSAVELENTRELFDRVRHGACCDAFRLGSFDKPLSFDFNDLMETLRDVGAVYRYEGGGSWWYGFCTHFVPALMEKFNIDVYNDNVR